MWLFFVNDEAYKFAMKIFLYIVAFFTLIGPFAVWTYIILLANTHKINSPNSGIQLRDYWDTEFFMLAALPWLIGIVCLIAAWLKR